MLLRHLPKTNHQALANLTEILMEVDPDNLTIYYFRR